jgi:hypothetical protein
MSPLFLFLAIWLALNAFVTAQNNGITMSTMYQNYTGYILTPASSIQTEFVTTTLPTCTNAIVTSTTPTSPLTLSTTTYFSTAAELYAMTGWLAWSSFRALC